MSSPLSNMQPTRMQLLVLEKQKKIAERGESLLREKLDALMIEFFGIVREIHNLKAKSRDLLAKAYLNYSEAQTILGFLKLQQASFTIQDTAFISAKTRNVIGLSLPYLEPELQVSDIMPYSILDTSAKLDDSSNQMREALKILIQLAGQEVAVMKLVQAIASTKRRVNSLEYIVIPNMVSIIKYIEMHLEEREREDFFRLKHIKKKLERERT